jgi:Telomere regulation protein Stn1
VKLTASGIYRTLRSRPGFGTHRYDGSSVSYQREQSHNPSSLPFYLNHPVQFVYVAGVVVAFDDYKRLWVFTVDDSGGATINVTCRKPEKVKEQNDKKSA